MWLFNFLESWDLVLTVVSIMNVKMLKTIPEGSSQEFESLLIYKKSNSRIARNGAEFLMVELGDKTGSFSVTCFSDTPSFMFFKNTPEGSIVRVNGLSDYYQGRFSPKVTQAEMILKEELAASGALEDLVESSPENVDALWNELQDYINSIAHEGLRVTVIQVMEEIEAVFKFCPAAVSMHHAYRSGLLEHTVHVTRAGNALLPLYPEINRDLAIAGMLLHDVGKTIEYEGDMAIRRTRTGILQGHVVLGYRMARKAAMQTKLDPVMLERLEHIILSHQGELEWGAAAMAATPEAVFVSMVDNLDAKMGMVQQVLRKSDANDVFSDYLPGLKSSLLVE